MKGFVRIEEKEPIKEAASIKGFKRYGKNNIEKKIDLFLQGAVAIDLWGNRIGKGAGFGDKEWQYFKDRGFINKGCLSVLLVHDVQVLKENISNLMQPYDKKVECIITLTRVIHCCLQH